MVVDVVYLDICGVVFSNPYFWDQDEIYFKKLNQYILVKNGVSYDIIEVGRRWIWWQQVRTNDLSILVRGSCFLWSNWSRL